MNIPVLRVHTQQLATSTYTEPAQVVRWFGAMQAQDFAAAKWAIGLRTKNNTDASIEKAFNEGKILRTHIMRPTWHFVTPDDIRWLLALTSPRVHAYNGYYYRRSGLTKDIFRKSNDLIRHALQHGQQLTRSQLRSLLENAKIPVEDLGLTYTLLQAELDGIICSGPRIGKQFTYMLLEERVPKSRDISRDEALGEITQRYFQSHGPAQLQDFCWWSGLTTKDAMRGMEIARLQKATKEDKTYYVTQTKSSILPDSVFLLPPFDEYFVAYKDRSDILDQRYKKHMNFGGGMINGAIISNGIVIGTWRRVVKKGKIIITVSPFTSFTKKEFAEITTSAQKYGTFYSLPVHIE